MLQEEIAYLYIHFILWLTMLSRDLIIPLPAYAYHAIRSKFNLVKNECSFHSVEID